MPMYNSLSSAAVQTDVCLALFTFQGLELSSTGPEEGSQLNVIQQWLWQQSGVAQCLVRVQHAMQAQKQTAVGSSQCAAPVQISCSEAGALHALASPGNPLLRWLAPQRRQGTGSDMSQTTAVITVRS